MDLAKMACFDLTILNYFHFIVFSPAELKQPQFFPRTPQQHPPLPRR
jgi:hypothetical protein